MGGDKVERATLRTPSKLTLWRGAKKLSVQRVRCSQKFCLLFWNRKQTRTDIYA